MIPPRVDRVVETALYVSDLARSVKFYRLFFGFELLYSEGDRLRALDIGGKQILLLFRVGASTEPSISPGGKIPAHDGRGTLHLAFAIASAAVEDWRRWLGEHQVEIESEVDCGGRSIYLRDPDNHLIELITPGCWPTY